MLKDQIVIDDKLGNRIKESHIKNNYNSEWVKIIEFSNNLIVEIKSSYTMMLGLDKNLSKMEHILFVIQYQFLNHM